MSTTLTISDLPLPVTQKLRMHAANHGRSIEAEARDILTRAVNGDEAKPVSIEAMKEQLRSVTGIWKASANGKSTDEIMRELRGDE